MDSTWENRDLPVLAAAAEELDREHATDPETIARATGLERGRASGDITVVYGLTGEARRRVGAWPTPESLAARLVEALGEAAEQTPNPQERTRLQEAGRALANVGQAALAGILANALTGNPIGPA